MRWGSLAAILLLAAAQSKEEKGKLKILLKGAAAGEESFRLEEFDDGRLACFTRTSVGDASADSVLTLDSKTLRPRLYAAVHKAGKTETEIRLEWKDGKVRSKVRRGGPEIEKEHKTASTALLDTNCLAQLVPIARRFKEGKGTLKVFSPSSLSDVDLTFEDKGAAALAGKGRTVTLRRRLIVVGTQSIDYYEDDQRLPVLIEIPSRGLRAVREGFEDLVAPRAPEGVLETDVSITSGKLTLAGTFSRPRTGDKLPAVVLLADEGPADRNAHAALAYRLCADGIGVLRADKRDLARATLSDLVSDASAALAVLRARADVDPRRIGLVGHGEGAVIAAIVAARDESVRAVFMLAAPGKSLDALLLERLDRSLRDSETTDEQRASILADEKKRFERIRASSSDTMVIDEKETFIGWMREHFNHDPAEQIRKVPATVVVFQGLADRAVSADHADRLEEAMKRAGKENFEVLRFEGLDHGFQKSGAPDTAFLKSLADRAVKYLK